MSGNYRNGLASGFLQGQSIFNSVQGMFKKGQQERAIDEIANAKPEESQGFTAQQGQQLEGLAKQGFDNITFDDKTQAYVAKNAAGEAKTVAMGGVTDFMGERTAGSMSREQQDNTRMLAVADVLGKTDPARGIQMRQQVQQGQHATKRQGREEKQWAIEDDVERIDSEIGQKFKQSLIGPDGAPRQATADDYLANSQQRAFALAQSGHTKAADQAMRDHMAQSHIKIQMEGAQRKEAIGKAASAAGAGDYSVMVDAYNRYVPSGLKVTGIESGKDGQLVMTRTGIDGKPVEPMTFKNQGELLSMMQSLENPMALYQYSQGESNNQFRLNADKRAGNADRRADRADGRAAAADGRAAASHSAAMSDRREIPSVREAIAREADPNISEAGARAARLGVIPVPGSTKEKYNLDPVKEQKALGELIPGRFEGDPDKVKRNPAEEKKFAQFMADNNIRDSDRALVLYRQSKVKADKTNQQPPKKLSGKSEFDKLPSGVKFLDPNGILRIKP